MNIQSDWMEKIPIRARAREGMESQTEVDAVAVAEAAGGRSGLREEKV